MQLQETLASRHERGYDTSMPIANILAGLIRHCQHLDLQYDRGVARQATQEKQEGQFEAI